MKQHLVRQGPRGFERWVRYGLVGLVLCQDHHGLAPLVPDHDHHDSALLVTKLAGLYSFLPLMCGDRGHVWNLLVLLIVLLLFLFSMAWPGCG